MFLRERKSKSSGTGLSRRAYSQLVCSDNKAIMFSRQISQQNMVNMSGLWLLQKGEQ